MSNFHFYCAICGQALHAPRTDAGGLINCVCCGRVVPVPGYPIGSGESARCLGLYRPEVLEIVMKFLCPGCKAKLSIDIRWEGRASECPRCKTMVTAPLWSSTTPDKLLPESDRPVSAPAVASFATLSPAEIEFLSGTGDDIELPAVAGRAS